MIVCRRLIFNWRRRPANAVIRSDWVLSSRLFSFRHSIRDHLLWRFVFQPASWMPSRPSTSLANFLLLLLFLLFHSSSLCIKGKQSIHHHHQPPKGLRSYIFYDDQPLAVSARFYSSTSQQSMFWQNEEAGRQAGSNFCLFQILSFQISPIGYGVPAAPLESSTQLHTLY